MVKSEEIRIKGKVARIKAGGLGVWGSGRTMVRPYRWLEVRWLSYRQSR